MSHDTNIPEKWVVQLLCCVGFCSILVPKVYQIFDATVQKNVSNALKTTAHTFLFRSRLRLRNSSWECALVAPVCDFGFLPSNDDF